MTGAKRSRIRAGCLVLLAAGAVALAGCASSASSPSPSAGTGKASVVKLGLMADITSQTGPTYSALPQVVQLAVNQLNNQGGIAGHPVQLVTCDLQFLPDQATICARNMVSAGVAAVLVEAGTGQEFIPPVLAAAGIPYFPAQALEGTDLSSKVSFPLLPAVLQQLSQGYLAAKECKNPVLVSFQNPLSDLVTQIADLGYKAGGGTGKLRIVLAPANVTDWAPTASEAVSTDPDCIMPTMNETYDLAFYPALEQTGWHDRSPGNRLVGYQGAMYTQKILTDFPALVNNMLATDLTVPLDNPMWDSFNAMIAPLQDKNLTNLTSSTTEVFYINFLAFVSAARQVAAAGQPITSKTVYHMLQTSPSISAGGFIAPFTSANAGKLAEWPRMSNFSVIFENVVNDKIVALNGGKFVNLLPAIQQAVQAS